MNRMNRILLVSAALAMLAPSTFGQADKDRLLPESFTRLVGLQWKQDGRVIEVVLQNPKDKWLITEATFEVEYPAQSPAATSPAPEPTGKDGTSKRKVQDLTLEDFLSRRSGSSRSIHKVRLNALPGRTESTHIELPSSDPASGFKLAETRGREPTRLERLKSTLQ